jgi:E3 ubiquitin-protein ligase RFWD2
MHSSWEMCVVTNILIFLGLGLQAISKPAAWHRFGSANPEESDDDLSPHFISAVCWKSESPTMLAANSQGTIKVLVLAP